VFLARENSCGAGFALERRILQSKTIVILVSAVSVDEIWSDVNKGCVSLASGARHHCIFIYPAFILPRARALPLHGPWPFAVLAGQASVWPPNRADGRRLKARKSCRRVNIDE
jgi:hypothetical protein